MIQLRGALLVICSLFLGYTATAKEQVKYDWLLIYYMPYDNNLSELSTTIMDQIKSANYKGNVCVTLQVDLAGHGGMTRYTFNTTIDSVNIENENSASSETLTDYLLWAAHNYKAKNNAIIFLNHGGKLNEYGSDLFPEEDWMPINEMAYAIDQFNKVAGIDKTDLLFEQICTRSTIENLYEFKNVAEFTLASQDLLPAPGYYYKEVISTLGEGEIETGNQLADLIVSAEREDMYYSLTLINNTKWPLWMKSLNKYTKTLSSGNYHLESSQIKLLLYEDQTYFDINSLIEATTLKVMKPRINEESEPLSTQDLVEKLYINPHNNRVAEYSGLSILSPFSGRNTPLKIYNTAEYSDYISILKKISKN